MAYLLPCGVIEEPVTTTSVLLPRGLLYHEVAAAPDSSANHFLQLGVFIVETSAATRFYSGGAAISESVAEAPTLAPIIMTWVR